METYKVRAFQNLFDVALHLHGSIEGLFDLLLSNPDLNMTSDLQPDQMLNYHKEFVLNADIVQQLQEKSLVPINGQREVEPILMDDAPCIYARTHSNACNAKISLSGRGSACVDWGDGSCPEHMVLRDTPSAFRHIYAGGVPQEESSYAIKVYGTLDLDALDLSELPATVYIIRELPCRELKCQGYIGDLQFIPLLKKLTNIDVRHSIMPNLATFNDCDFRNIDMSEVVFASSSALADFLEYRLANHRSTGTSNIIISGPVSPREQQLMDALSNSEDFNEAGTGYTFTVNNNNLEI